MLKTKSWILLGAMLALGGCGDDDPVIDDGGVAVDGGTTADGGVMVDDGGVMVDDGGTGDVDGGPPALCPTGDAVIDAIDDAAFAVLSTDYTSTVLSLVDADGTVQTGEWLTSGTTAPGLTAALSGDVALPSTQEDGTFSVIDRLNTDVITRFCADGSLIGQLRVAPAEGFSSNPQDTVILSPTEAWVSRYEWNADDAAAPEDRGTDLLGFNPSTMELNGERIDLSSFNETITGNNTETMAPAEVFVVARPSRIAEASDHLVVGLERLPANLFGTIRGASAGTVAIVDPADGTVEGFELTGLKNCGAVTAVEGSDSDVIVACQGYSDIGFTDAAGVRATAGIVRLSIDADGTATEVSRWAAADNADSVVALNNVVSLGDNIVVAYAPGDFATVTDRLFRIDLGDDAQSLVATGIGNYAMGRAALRDGTLWLPDSDGTMGTQRGLRRFDTTADFAEGEQVDLADDALGIVGAAQAL